MTIMADRGSLAWEVYAAGWREVLHPRGKGGKFAHKPGGGESAPGVSTPEEFHAVYLPAHRKRLDALKAEADRLGREAARLDPDAPQWARAERAALKAMSKYYAALDRAAALEKPRPGVRTPGMGETGGLPVAAPQSGEAVGKSFLRIGHAESPTPRKDGEIPRYGIFGVRDTPEGQELYVQYEGTRKGSVYTGLPIVVSDTDSEPYFWIPAKDLAGARIFPGRTTGLRGEDFPGQLAGLIAHQLSLAEGAEAMSDLRTALSAARAERWESAISRLYQAAVHSEDHLEQRTAIIQLADQIQATYSRAQRVGPHRAPRGGHPPEWVAVRVAAELKDPKACKGPHAIRAWLEDADGILNMGYGTPESAAKILHMAGDKSAEAGFAGQARRYHVWAANLERWPAEQEAREAAKLASFTKRMVTKGSRRVPTILGGGREAWDGTVDVWDDFDEPGLLADINWDGHMRLLGSVAKGIRADTDMRNEPVNALDSWTVPLHELIHGTIGGRAGARDAKIKAAVSSGEITDNERWLLVDFHNRDLDSADRGRHVYTMDDLLQDQGPSSLKDLGGPKGLQARVDSLIERGYVYRADFRQQIWRQGETGPKDYEYLYGLTAKGEGMTPLDSEPWAASERPYQVPVNRAIEEGFTELGTVYHAADWFKAMGIGDRLTPFLASARAGPGLPDPKLAAALEAEIRKAAGDAGPREFYQAAKALREGSLGGTVAWLRKARGRSDAQDRQVDRWLDEVVDVFSEHTIANPLYKQRSDQLQRHLLAEAAKINARVKDPGEWAPDRVTAPGTLAPVAAAMERAQADIESYDLVGALEEIAKLQHVGDKELWTDAKVLRAEVDKLQGTSIDRYATTVEYAERLTDPHRIRTGQAWGHYADFTRQALDWVAAVAHAEGLAEGTPAWDARVRELADEINREGTASKGEIMARQVLRVAGDPEPSRPWVDTLGLAIRQHYGETPRPGSTTPTGPFAWAVNWLENPPAGLRPPEGYQAPAVAAAAALAASMWHTPSGEDAAKLLDAVDAGTLSVADAIAALGRLAEEAPDTASLHEVQDVAKIVGRLTGKVAAAGWRPELHPRDRRGKWARKPGGQDPLAPAHTAAIEAAVAGAFAAGKATSRTETLDAAGQIWSPERAAIHNEIVAAVMARAAAIPRDRKAILGGGLPGAGKTTALHALPGVNPDDYLAVAPDDFKVELAQRGLIPEVAGLTPMEASPLVSDEAHHIATLVLARAVAERRNIIIDLTMHPADHVEERVAELHAAGYSVDGMYVHVPVETSVERANARYAKGAATKLGGRYVPPDDIRRIWGTGGPKSRSHLEFDRVRGQFDRWELVDNSQFGHPPVLLSSSVGAP